MPEDEPYEASDTYQDLGYYGVPTTPKSPPKPAAPQAPTPVARPSTPTPSAPKPAVSYGSLFGTPALKKKPPQNTLSDGGPAPTPILTAAPTSATLDVPAPKPTAAPVPAALANTWSSVMQDIKRERIHVGSVLQQAVLDGYDDGTLTFAVPDAFHQRLLENQGDYICDHIRQRTAIPVARIRFVIREIEQEATESETADTFDPYGYIQQKRETHEGLRTLLDTFGGEIVW